MNQPADFLDPSHYEKVRLPLRKTPNLIITAHCSSDDLECYTPDTLDLVFTNMRRFIAGRPLLNRVSRRYPY